MTNNAIIDSKLNRNLIHLCNNTNYSIDSNWWSTNNPNFNILTDGVIPNNWRIMTFTNTTIKVNNTISLNVGLNTLNTGKTIKDKIPYRTVIFNSTVGNFNKNKVKINSKISVNYTGADNKPVANIDNQQLTLNDKKEPFINVNDIKTFSNKTVNIQINTNSGLKQNITVKINNSIVKSIKSNGVVNLNYAVGNDMRSGNYSIKVEYPGDNNYLPHTATATLEIYNTHDSKYNNVITPLTHHDYTYVTNLPSKYDPRILNITTPLKDQGNSGSCWVFAAMGTLESNIKKVTNRTYDLSENHAKNVISKYSIIGNQNQIPNTGGRAEEIIPYLVGWYGPVDEMDDPYVDYSSFSPEYNVSYHVQDVIILPNRQNINDFKKLK
jgi:C1A family cysteine protease